MELAGGDPSRLDDIWKTVRLTDGLEAFAWIQRRQAEEEFRHDEAMYAAGIRKKPPSEPTVIAAKKKKRRVGGPLEYKAPEKGAWIEMMEQQIPKPKRRR